MAYTDELKRTEDDRLERERQELQRLIQASIIAGGTNAAQAAMDVAANRPLTLR